MNQRNITSVQIIIIFILLVISMILIILIIIVSKKNRDQEIHNKIEEVKELNEDDSNKLDNEVEDEIEEEAEVEKDEESNKESYIDTKDNDQRIKFAMLDKMSNCLSNLEEYSIPYNDFKKTFENHILTLANNNFYREFELEFIKSKEDILEFIKSTMNLISKIDFKELNDKLSKNLNDISEFCQSNEMKKFFLAIQRCSFMELKAKNLNIYLKVSSSVIFVFSNVRLLISLTKQMNSIFELIDKTKIRLFEDYGVAYNDSFIKIKIPITLSENKIKEFEGEDLLKLIKSTAKLVSKINIEKLGKKFSENLDDLSKIEEFFKLEEIKLLFTLIQRFAFLNIKRKECVEILLSDGKLFAISHLTLLKKVSEQVSFAMKLFDSWEKKFLENKDFLLKKIKNELLKNYEIMYDETLLYQKIEPSYRYDFESAIRKWNREKS